MRYPQRPQRPNVPNAWQVAGAAAQDVGGQLGQFSDKQQRLRASFQQLVDRRKQKTLAEMDAMDRRRREETDLELRRKREEREAAAAAKPKKWEPTTMEEAIQFEQKKAALKPPKGPSESERSRLIERENADKMTNVIWEKIDRMWQKRPDEKAYLDENGQPKTDVITGLPLRQAAVDAWRKGMAALQKELNDTEVAAGLQPTQSPFTAARSKSPSFLRYAQRAYPGKYPMPGSGTAPAPAAPARQEAPASDRDEDIAAFLESNGYQASPEAIQTVRQRMGGAQ